MTKAQLAGFVNSIQKPKLKNSEVINLIDREDFDFVPINKQVAQRRPQEVVQSKPLSVAQDKPQQVAQAVAQGSWVAQAVPQRVAQNTPPTVAQNKPQQVVQRQADKDVEKFKEQIYQIQTIEARKKFVISIGFGIASEKRGGKKIYLYGIKKIDGKKYRLYIGNSTKL
jgi:hypothetical protein